jgi:hypothetical protein
MNDFWRGMITAWERQIDILSAQVEDLESKYHDPQLANAMSNLEKARQDLHAINAGRHDN